MFWTIRVLATSPERCHGCCCCTRRHARAVCAWTATSKADGVPDRSLARCPLFEFVARSRNNPRNFAVFTFTAAANVWFSLNPPPSNEPSRTFLQTVQEPLSEIFARLLNGATSAHRRIHAYSGWHRRFQGIKRLPGLCI
jgi:hypothetical protein